MTSVMPVLPPRISRLTDLAYNLWWSWHTEVREVFAAIDQTRWSLTAHNPVKLLVEVEPERLQALAHDPSFLRRYDAAVMAFDADMKTRETWVARTAPHLTKASVAYFSAEFGIHSSLPIYGGGLGILAGKSKPQPACFLRSIRLSENILDLFRKFVTTAVSGLRLVKGDRHFGRQAHPTQRPNA